MFKHVCIVWGVGLSLVALGLAVKSAPSSAPSAQAQQQPKHGDLAEQIATIKGQRDAWCGTNAETIKQALHGAVIKIDDGYMKELPRIPLTTVTVSYSIWKGLDEVQRRGLREAVRCHSKHRYGGQMKIVDLNGVMIDGDMLIR